MDIVELKQKFLKQLASQPALELLEYLPDTYFFAKDLDGRFMAANAAFVRGAGLGSESDLIGKSDLDVWPRHLAEGYRRDDRKVMQSGKPIINKLELSKNAKGGSDWFCTTKIPLRDKSGTVRGVAGFARDVKKSHSSFKPYMEMSKVIEYILSNYSDPLSLKSLASKAAMSPSQFERRFKKNFGATPMQYLRTIRIQAACQFLAETQLSISQIAFKTGHYDHSHFNRYFSQYMGQSATQYRAAHSPADSR
ncbi:MAG: transcriptional regulator with sensor, AraC family [Fibrobacteres bacterium]|nr:transcriptional regulator with sensor, AraC family [Fibrobacterota bacterium]